MYKLAEQTKGPNCKKRQIIIIINQKYLVPPYLFFWVFFTCLLYYKKKITGRDRHDLHHVRVHSSTDEFSNGGSLILHVTGADAALLPPTVRQIHGEAEPGGAAGGGGGGSRRRLCSRGGCAFGHWKSSFAYKALRIGLITL